jgi:hypothetical protein
LDNPSDRQLVEFKEQLKYMVTRHEATVEKIMVAQEKQIDRVLAQIKG